MTIDQIRELSLRYAFDFKFCEHTNRARRRGALARKAEARERKRVERIKCAKVNGAIQGNQEKEAIALFWSRFDRIGITVFERRELLIQMADVVIESSFSLTARRRYFERNKTRLMPFRSNSLCRVCELRKPSLRHHIIWLSNGGSNSKANLMLICEPCHEEPHAWLGRNSVS